MLINKNYIVLPVTYRMASKKLKFTENGKLIFDMDVCLDTKSPRALAYYDIKRFRGKDLEITVDPEMNYVPVLVDEPDETNLYREKYRPEVHFIREVRLAQRSERTGKGGRHLSYVFPA